MKSFQYASPSSLDEVVALLGSEWGEAALLAGGTDLVNAMKEGTASPQRVVSLRGVEALRGIEAGSDRVRIGATATLEDIRRHDAVREHLPALAAAADSIKSAQLRHVATLGGNLCQRPYSWFYRHGIREDGGEPVAPRSDNRYEAIFGNEAVQHVHPSSLAPVLLALGATCSVRGPEGQSREVPMAEFYRVPESPDQRESVLEPNEVIVEVVVPLQGLRSAQYAVKPRQCVDWPLVEAVVAFSLEGGTARDARVALGHVAPVPWNAEAAARALEGREVTEETAAQAGEAAAEGARPLSMNGYKVQLVKVAVKRAALAAAGKPVEA